jgi:2-polyprenyl-6-methoxyphenol hydroxylase-like FAD-dependent oxidoreductase
VWLIPINAFPCKGFAAAFYNRRMAKTYDVCIRGAGIVGRSLALHLAAKRLRVALVANDQPGNPAHSDVRAYALSPASRKLLEAIRCWPDEAHATPVTRMQVQGDHAEPVVFDASKQGVPALNWIVDVPVLESLLKEAVRFQPLIDMVDQPAKAELTVVCEGRASKTREEFGVEFDVKPYMQWALAARVRCAVGHGQVARQWFDNGDILALLPLEGTQGTLCALVWSVSPERAQTLLDMDPESFCRELEGASQGALGSLELSSERKTWPLQAAQARRWIGTAQGASWVLAGDAAHNVHPLAGQGLNLGLGDVAELVKVLDHRAYWRSVGDPKLLRTYERARKADFAVVGGSGDALQQLFGQQHPAWQTLRKIGMLGFERSGPLKQWITGRAMGTKHHTSGTP